jgi:hypothetical protein
MPDPVEEYIKASDNASDYSDHLMDELQQEAAEDIDDMFRSAENRDADLWALWQVNPELVVDDYDAVPRLERGLDWTLGLAGISAASTTQFFLENSEETILKPVAYREQVLEPFNLTRAQMIQVGKRGTEYAVQTQFVVLEADFVGGMGFIRGIPTSELYERLLADEAILPIEKRIADASGYVARMTSLPPGSVQFKEEVANLVNVNSTRNLKKMNRRAVERIYSFREANGDGKTLMIWLVESEKPCVYCVGNAGEIDTYENWIINGLPGAETCAGGDL